MTRGTAEYRLTRGEPLGSPPRLGFTPRDRRATPSWWRHSQDGSRTWFPVTVHAEDDRGGTYLSAFGGGTMDPGREEPGHEGKARHEELALRFLPRLDPLAHALTLTFRGANEEILVDLGLE